jgi:hypothetical protein
MRESLSLRRFSPPAIAAGLASASLFAALLLAAFNAIALAGNALVVAAVFVVVGIVAATYRALPADDQTHLLSRKVMKSTAITSLLLAIGVSCVYWYAGWMVFSPELLPIIAPHWAKLDFIPSVFSLLLPAGWQSGFHRYFNDMTYCFPGPYWWESMRYLRTAIPGYGVTFFLTLPLARLLWVTVRRSARPVLPKAAQDL